MRLARHPRRPSRPRRSRRTVRNAVLGAAAALAALLALPPTASAQDAAVRDRYVAEIDSILALPGVQRALEAAETLDPWGMETLVELTEIPAPPFMEEARARRFAELLREAGADSVWTDAEGNVHGLRRGRSGGRTVVIGGHLDTVFPEGTDVTVRMRGDTLYAPGVGDDARGLVVVLVVLSALEEAGVETEADVLFTGTVGEEGLGDLRGMKHIFPWPEEGAPADPGDPGAGESWAPDVPEIDAWIEVDGGGMGRIVNQALGSVRYRVTFRGPGGHSWGAFGTANPAHALGRAIRGFQQVADTLTRSGPRTSYNVGRIGGGTSVNSIPFEAWMEVDMRSVSPARLAEIEEVFLAAMEEALHEANGLRREGPPLELEADRIGDRPSGSLDPATPLVQRAMAATLAWDVEPTLARSSTNSNIPIALGIPAVTIGRGGAGGDAHSPGEWWLNEDGTHAIQRALVVLLAEAGLAGPGS